MKKLNVVHVIASSGMYGAEKWVLALLRGMEGSSVNSVLLNLTDAEGETSSVVTAAREKGLQAYDFYTGGAFNPLSIIRLASWLRKHSIDIVNGHGYKSDLIGLLAARMVGAKVLSTPHGWTKDSDVKLQLYEKLDRFIFRFMDYVCPLSEQLLASVKGCCPEEKVRLILNGVDLAEIDEFPVADGKKDDDIIIGYIGRFVEGKDLPTLLLAFRRVLNNMPESQKSKVKLSLVGDGDQRSYLQQRVKELALEDHVVFWGFRYDAVALLKQCDYFVLPSLSEGVPRCLMEAMAARVIVVASDIEGNRVLVNDGETGFLYEVGSEAALATTLERVMSAPDLCVDVQHTARRLIEDKFSNIYMAKEYEALYAELMS